MCGILGGNNPKWDYEKGIQSLYHRGPDGQCVERYDGLTLAFARLAIMDLSENGMQPMTSMDGNVTIVYNGEIYGYDKLRKELEHKYPFRSKSDTEVILYAYLEYGDNFIDKIDGMFALAIYDRRIMKLKLYRDRTGIKPLYYYCKGNQFAFASELKAITAACTDVRWETDYTALYDYLFYTYIPDPKTIYKNCYRLEPAHTLIYDLRAGKIQSIKKYWKLHVNTSVGRRRQDSVLCEELRDVLANSVKKQIIADVPVGCFLSGGVDSSITSYECSKINPGIHAYTIGFKDKQFDESVYAKIMTERYDINNTTQVLGYKEVENIKGNLQDWYDEPFADTSAYPTYFVSKMAREDVTVVLTGDGGDELFGGYDKYLYWVERLNEKKIDSELISRFGKKLKLDEHMKAKNIMKYINTSFENLGLCFLYITPQKAEEYRTMWGIDKDYEPYWYLKKYYKKELPPLTRARYLDYKTYLVGDILTKVDRASMRNSLEVRVPFLAKEVVEFAFSLSEEECYSVGELKRLLKKAYEDVIPKELLYRKKMGFCVPLDYLGNKNIPIAYRVLKREWKNQRF